MDTPNKIKTESTSIEEQITSERRGEVMVTHQPPNLDWLSETQINGSHRRFFLCRLGQSGSTWFAKLLNSHPDVFCSHERILSKIHPKTAASLEDQHHLIQWFAFDSQHETYRAVGDIGSIDLSLALELPRDKFTIGLLVSHPACQVIAHLQSTNLESYDPNQDQNQLQMETEIKNVFGIEAVNFPTADRVFLSICWLWYCILQNIHEVDYTLKLEDLFQIQPAQQALEALTGVKYDPQLIQHSLTGEERSLAGNVESPSIFFDKRPQQRHWYKAMVHPLAEQLGYTI